MDHVSQRPGLQLPARDPLCGMTGWSSRRRNVATIAVKTRESFLSICNPPPPFVLISTLKIITDPNTSTLCGKEYIEITNQVSKLKLTIVVDGLIREWPSLTNAQRQC
jgi:hypothetical protein